MEGAQEGGKWQQSEVQQNQLSLQNQQILQHKHQNQVIATFMNYERLMKQTSPGLDLYGETKRVRDIKYYQILQGKKKQMFQRAISCNQQFLKQIVMYCEGQQRLNSIHDAQITFDNFSKIKTTLKQFYREWCGQNSELTDYSFIVEKAKAYLKQNNRILAPGAGLGRLVLDFVQAGFGCQGNQVTYFMLYGSNFILNAAENEQQFTIYPFLSSSDYYSSEESIFRSVTIPDKAASCIVDEQADFSMTAGQFTEVYRKMKNQFQGVATCFFIDTANNIFEYVDTIYDTLKNQGIWINYGPLLFHYRQIYGQISVEVSWQILREYICDKFQILEEQRREASYCHDQKSEMGVKYDCLMFVCRKKEQKQKS